MKKMIEKNIYYEIFQKEILKNIEFLKKWLNHLK